MSHWPALALITIARSEWISVSRCAQSSQCISVLDCNMQNDSILVLPPTHTCMHVSALLLCLISSLSCIHIITCLCHPPAIEDIPTNVQFCRSLSIFDVSSNPLVRYVH